MSPTRRRKTAPFTLALLCLALLHAWLAVSGSDRVGVTSDEIAHITAGTTYWREHDYRMQPENGLLPQRLAGLPQALSSEVVFPDIIADSPARENWEKGNVWRLGARFFYESGNDLPALLARARCMIAVLGALGVVLIGLWARRLGGPGPGLFSATLAAFSPTLLAHAGVATSDTAAAVGFVGATSTFWALCHRVTLGRVIAAGLSAGLLALCKYSAVLLAPVAVVFIAMRLARRARLPVRLPGTTPRAIYGWRRLPTLLAAGAVAAALAVAVIWSGYGFRYEARGPRAPEGAGFDMPWDSVLMTEPVPSNFLQADGRQPPDLLQPMRAGMVQRVLVIARDARLLPEPWIYGFAFVERNARNRAAYLAGDWRMTGWWWFFPFAALVKSTPAELALAPLVLAAIFALSRGQASERRLAYRCLAPLAVIAIYGGIALTSSLNIGHRHILPLYFFGFVLVAIPAARALQKLRRGVALGLASAILLVQTGSAWTVRPHYLTYFNLLAGGPDGGYRYLVDSSLDWGQGLPELRDWLNTHATPADRVYLSYFGSDQPSRFGIHAVRMGDIYFRHNLDHLTVPVCEAGWYVFGATMWQRVYTHVRGPWTPSLETAYQRQLRFWTDPAKPEWDGDTRDTLTGLARYERLLAYEQLRYGRLLHFLRDRAPDAMVAHQLLVFHLDEHDVNRALYGPIDTVAEPSTP